MRYAIFTDIHANLEALEAVLAKIDAIDKEQPIDQVWFLGDLVGYGPDPNECIRVLRQRTDVIIAGNHDWAAVGKIDLEDFSPAARISAEWTAKELTEEHRDFLTNLPERLEIGDCTLVHGSPFGPLWEYLTSEPLAERSFQHFETRYCLVGHTHVPVIFIQPDLTNAPTIPLATSDTQAKAGANGANETLNGNEHGEHGESAAQTPVNNEAQQKSEPEDDDDETVELLIISPATQQVTTSTAASVGSALSAYSDPESGSLLSEEAATSMMEKKFSAESDASVVSKDSKDSKVSKESEPGELDDTPQAGSIEAEDVEKREEAGEIEEADEDEEDEDDDDTTDVAIAIGSESGVEGTDEQINGEIEELLNLLGLSQSMVQVTNEMLTPPEGHWEAPPDYRAIINPGGVGQPRDGDPRAAFMIYDTESGFEFYRIPYDFEKTQEKIIEAGLPQFLAVRLAYGR